MNKIDKAFDLALEVRKKAYAKYSNFLVGSVVKFKESDELFSGCNMENASYGLAICAERNAISTGIAKGHRHIEWILVLTDTPNNNIASPCGMCRQTISEFSSESTTLYLANINKNIETINFNSIFPKQFKL